MSEPFHTSKNMLPPKPGANGRAAVFVCSECGKKFARTIAGQSKCLACLKKETPSNNQEAPAV